MTAKTKAKPALLLITGKRALGACRSFPIQISILKVPSMDSTQPLLYIELLNGRNDPHQQMQGWGTEGPVLGPFPYVQVTYASEIKTEMPAGTPCILSITGDHLVYYDGVYYGDFGVCAIGDIELESPLKARPVAFDPTKAALPRLNDGSDLEAAITEVLKSSSALDTKLSACSN